MLDNYEEKRKKERPEYGCASREKKGGWLGNPVIHQGKKKEADSAKEEKTANIEIGLAGSQKKGEGKTSL